MPAHFIIVSICVTEVIILITNYETFIKKRDQRLNMNSETEDLKKGLSKGETFLLAKLSSGGKNFITVDDIEETLECSHDNAKRIASDLAKKKWLERVERGKYIIVPLEAGEKGLYTEHEYLVASQLISPYYVGYWSALNFHHLTEQVPYTVFVATTKKKKSKNLHGVDYKFVTLTEGKFFGWEEYDMSGGKVKISSPEKTLIDSLDRLEYSGGLEEVSKALKNAEDNISKEKLVDYALRLDNGSVIKRLIYLLDLLEIEIKDDLREKLVNNLTAGFALLDPSKDNKGTHRSKWKIKVNVPEEKILEWSEGR